MKRLEQKQFLPMPLAEAWAFFSSPNNLNDITPADMHFEVKSVLPDVMYEGLFISYKIRPMFNIPLNWCTEITHIREQAFFVDEQRLGPYKIWHHEHHFQAHNSGTLMTDILHYEIGKGPFGWLAGHLFVDKRVREIFDFRYQALEKRFGVAKPQ